MPAYAVIGGQWGDEGKGKVIDYLAGSVDYVIRYAGGNNAGHTVVNDQGTFQLHLVPSGICWPDVYGIIGNGVVVNPDVLAGELEMLASRGIDTSRLYVSERAHVIMPYHILLDHLEEEARGAGAIGTTGQGVGPAYMDKAGRPKIVRECTYPPTGIGCVGLIVSDISVIEVGESGLVLREVAPGWTAEEVQRETEAGLDIAPDLRVMEL